MLTDGQPVLSVCLMAPQSFDTNPSCSFLSQCHVIEETVMADLCWQLCYEVHGDKMKAKAVLWRAFLSRSSIIVLIYRDRWQQEQMSSKSCASINATTNTILLTCPQWQIICCFVISCLSCLCDCRRGRSLRVLMSLL